MLSWFILQTTVEPFCCVRFWPCARKKEPQGSPPNFSLFCYKVVLYWKASQVALVVKNLPANAGGDMGSISKLGRPPGGGNGNPLQYSCLENPTDTGPGGLQSMGSQTVGHWSGFTRTYWKASLSVAVFGIKCAFFTHTAKFVVWNNFVIFFNGRVLDMISTMKKRSIVWQEVYDDEGKVRGY